MLKTNSKAARQNIRQYIMNHSEYLTEVYEATTEKQIIASIAQAYKDEYLTAHTPMTQKHFTEWASGLTCGDLFDFFDFGTVSAVDTLGEILQESEEERNRYTEQQAAECFAYLIYREVLKAIS